MMHPVTGVGLARPLGRTTADAAAEALFEAILSGDITPGSPLRLQQIADQLGISVMPVREAVRKLDALGLVEMQPHRGARLRPLSREDLLDTYFTRANLEMLAVRAAAHRFTDEHARAAQDALDEQRRLKQYGDQVGARVAHERFHFVLYDAAGSAWLTRSILPAWRNAERYRVLSMRHRSPNDERRHREHQELLQALVARDEETAAKCLVKHLSSSIRAGLELVAPAGAAIDGVQGMDDAQVLELVGLQRGTLVVGDAVGVDGDGRGH